MKASWRRTREMRAFTWGLMGSRSLRFLSENIDNVLVGRYLGPAELAFYALAYRLLKLPIRLMARSSTKWRFLHLALQDHKTRLQNWFLMASRAMATGSYGP